MNNRKLSLPAWLPYRFLVAAIYVCVLFLDRMDVTIVNVALPTLARIFGVPVTQTDWISTGFLLALAVVIPASGWAGDRFGSKRVFAWAIVCFTVGSALCATAQSLEALVFFRVLQGVGGGVLVPVGMAMTYRNFAPHEYPKVATYTLMPTLVAPAIAPAVGGFLLEHASWQWIFLINLPLCAVALVLSLVYLKEDSIVQKSPFDWPGFLFAAVGLGTLLFALSRLGQKGIKDPLALIAGAISLASAFLFVWREKRAKDPMIDLKFFKVPLFVQANLIQTCLQICYFGSLFLIALYLQEAVGMSPLQSGFVLFAQPCATIAMLPFSARFFQKWGPKPPIILGLLGLSLTTALILWVQNAEDTLKAVCLLVIRGLFIGCVNGPLQASAFFDIEKSGASRASAIFNAGRQVAISLGVALSALVLAFGQEKNSFHNAFFMMTAIALVGVLITATIDNKKIRQKLERKNK